jgi:hypothetical protein
MAAEVEDVGPERWGVPTLSYAGFLPWWQALLHVLWDSWIHERDALLPLGLPVDEIESEVTVGLCYVLALGQYASRRHGRGEPVDAVVCGFRVTASEGPIMVVPVSGVDQRSGTVPVLTGHPPSVVDALSGRGDLDEVLTGDGEVLHRLGFLGRFLSSTGPS